MAYMKKSCFTLTLRIGFLVVAVASLVIFGFIGSVFPTIVEMILKAMIKKPSLLKLATAMILMADNLYNAMRVMGFALFLSSCFLLTSWFLMNKYSGSGPSDGVFSSCFAAANPFNLNKRKNLKWWMLPWAVLQVLFFIVVLYLTIDVILQVSGLGVVTYLVMVIGIIVMGLIQAYCVLVVASYYLEQTETVM